MADEKLTSQIVNKILKDPSVQYGLKEFDGIKAEQVLDIFEKEKGKFYLKCLTAPLCPGIGQSHHSH